MPIIKPQEKEQVLKEKNKIGRPTRYTPELAKEICKTIATHSVGLDVLHKMYDHIPEKRELFRWIYDHPEFRHQYFEARRLQTHVLADDIISLSPGVKTYQDKDGVERIDSGILGRSKLEFETKKWHASKMEPKVFGDYKQIEELMTEKQELLEECKRLREKLDAKNKKDY